MQSIRAPSLVHPPSFPTMLAVASSASSCFENKSKRRLKYSHVPGSDQNAPDCNTIRESAASAAFPKEEVANIIAEAGLASQENG